ncbi:hypothetical protein BR63_08355 [Thermanaerosceptrum fracticalcis]|uniref:PucR family transcriptional regulator n=1 Tax=Thermanaerosceptrum fracticalcis TaxID=1712410 RepID=A0A7G6E2L9_THEFR|nr:PucR family transcriptional regulator [Thermanaerosceptrum fracticalcis]QNB46323.1 hypothetical protein BR63_08355 [Thermanaerosceptrum fracticalcis]
MGITVKEALKIGGLRTAKVLAGHGGIDREIKSVTVMEVPDIVQWLKGNELILTSGFAVSKNEEDRIRLIQDLAKKGIAGLVVKAKRFLDTIPPEMLETANEYALPIIEMEQQIPYLEVINPIMTEIINRETARLLQFEMIHRKLSEVIFSGGGLYESLYVLAGVFNNPVAVVDRKLKVLGESPENWLNSALLRDIIQKTTNPLEIVIPREALPYYVFPLILEGVVEGYLIVGQENNPIERNALLSVESSLPLLAVDLLRRKAVDQVEKSFRNDFIEDLLLGHIKTESVAQRRAHFLGLPEKGSFLILVLHCSPKIEPNQAENFRYRYYEELQLNLKPLGYSVVAMTDSRNLVVLLNLPQTESQNVFNLLPKFHQELKVKSSCPLSLGVGDVFHALTDARKSFLEASEALEFGRKVWGEGSCTLFSEIGVYRLLCSFPSHEELKKFIPRGLNDLVDYDRAHKTDLVKTLECYLRNGGNAKKTASELFIHYKTLQYRLERISEIACTDLEAGERRLDLHLGLKILDLLAKQGSC